MPVALRRVAAVAVRAFRAPRTAVSRLPHRVHLTYVDLYRHMNYATYLEVMELGRWDWGFRSGAVRRWLAERLMPVVVKVNIEYRRELKPLQRFVVDTRLVAAERRMLRFDQYLLVDDKVHAKASVYALMRRRGRVVGADVAARFAAAFLSEPLEVVGHRVVTRRDHAASAAAPAAG